MNRRPCDRCDESGHYCPARVLRAGRRLCLDCADNYPCVYARKAPVADTPRYRSPGRKRPRIAPEVKAAIAASPLSMRECARHYEVSTATVSSIRKRAKANQPTPLVVMPKLIPAPPPETIAVQMSEQSINALFMAAPVDLKRKAVEVLLGGQP